MASLKEIKGRIASVNGTLKITSAMKLVASAKLRRAQDAIVNMLPYQALLQDILSNLLGSVEEVAPVVYAQQRPVHKVAIVCIASNSSLCGAFNSTAVKMLREAVDGYLGEGISRENIVVIPIGRKMAEAARKLGFAVSSDNVKLCDRPSYAGMSEIASSLMSQFEAGTIDRVEFIYNHFRSTASYKAMRDIWLPLALPSSQNQGNVATDYIVEPDIDTLIAELLPKSLMLSAFTKLLDSAAAEHSARTVAMQTATDNGNALLQDLTLEYNKRRQQKITDELLDLEGGSIA